MLIVSCRYIYVNIVSKNLADYIHKERAVTSKLLQLFYVTTGGKCCNIEFSVVT